MAHENCQGKDRKRAKTERRWARIAAKKAAREKGRATATIVTDRHSDT